MVNFNNPVEASVLIEGEPAPEYETGEDEEGTNNATRYIESKPGAYSIQIAIGRSFLCNSSYCVALCLIIDGQKEYRALDFQGTSSNGLYMCNWSGACSTENGQHLEKPYIFSCVTPSKDGNNLVSDSEIGTICLEIWRAEYDSARENEPRGPTSFNPVTNISDKTTKWSGIHHITSLGEGKIIEESKHWNHLPVQTLDSNPLCTIKFRYRSREALKELGDIPAPGSLTVRVKETHEEECLRGERLNMFLHNPYEMPNLNRGAERSPMGMGATTGTLPLHIKPPEARNSSGGVTPSNNCPDQYLPDN